MNRVDFIKILENRNIKYTIEGNDLVINGYLDLRGCTSLVSLPNDLIVNGCLGLENCTSLKSLPDDLVINGYLDLRNCTSLKSLPNDLVVNGYLDLRGCTSLINPNFKPKKLKNGDYIKNKYLYVDNILTLVKTKKRILDKYDYFIGKFKNQNVIYDNKFYAHCSNIKEGINDLEFKYAKDRGLDQFNKLNLDSIISHNEAKNMYRIITGACNQGTNNFINNMGKNKKDFYSIRELINLTKNQYNSNIFERFFSK